MYDFFARNMFANHLGYRWVPSKKTNISHLGKRKTSSKVSLKGNTVDGRNPAPGMYKTRKLWDILHINWCRISSINSTLVPRRVYLGRMFENPLPTSGHQISDLISCTGSWPLPRIRRHTNSMELTAKTLKIPSLKLTLRLKKDVWKTSFLLGRPIK